MDDKQAFHLINEIESSENRERRALEYKAYKVSEGAQGEYVKATLKTLFPKSFKTMRVADISLSKKVLDKLAAYKSQPIRTCGEKTQELLDLYENGDFYTSLSVFDRDLTRQKYALMWVNFTQEKIRLMPLKGFESFVVTDKNTGDLSAVVLNYPASEVTSTGFGISDGINQDIMNSADDLGACRVYVVWTAESHKAYLTNGKSCSRLVDEANPEGVNPWGVLPFVWRNKSDTGALPFINPITEQSITTNILYSDYLTGASNQSHGQLVIRAPKEVDIGLVHSGQATAIKLPLLEGREQQPEASYINANPDLEGMQKAVYSYVESVLNENGLVSDTAKIDYTSGLERLIAQSDAQNAIAQQQRILVGVEKEIFSLVQLMMPEFAGEELTVAFEKPKVLISDAETLANIEKRINLGLITKVEALKMLDPNLTDEQAEEKLAVIEEERNGKIRSLLRDEARPQERTESIES